MFTLNKLFIIFLFIIKTTTCLANSVKKNEIDTSSFTVTRGANIIYYVELSNQKNQYLIPFIESELKNMKDQKDYQKRTLFNSVQSFNYLTSGDKANDTLMSTFLTKSTRHLKHSKKEIEERQRIIDHLKSNQFFFKIDINILNTLIEYQFILYKITKNPINDFNYLELEHYRTTSIFVNPDNPDYKSRLRMALRQIITEANEAPVPFVLMNGKKITDTVFTKLGEFKLTATATDFDSPEDQLKYDWEVGKPPLVYFRESGKELGVLAREIGAFTVTLRVSDGIKTTVLEYPVVVKNKPTIEILPPKNYGEDQFLNNRYILYSYHKTFRFNDFSSIFAMSRKSINFAGDTYYSRWSKIIPELNIVTSVNEPNIGFSAIKFNKIGEDSISNYIEKPMPYLSSEYYWQLSDESSLFNLNYAGQSVYKLDTTKLSSESPKLYTYTYSILENNNSTEIIKIPNTRYFKVTVYDHNIQNSLNFLIQFKKIDRLSAILNLSQLTNVVNKQSLNWTLFGVGGEYLVSRGISIEGTFGTSTSTSFSSAVLPFYKIGANLNLISYYNFVKASFIVSDILKKTYSYSSDGRYFYYEDYRSRVGFGTSLETGFSKSQYFPVSEGFYFLYYPVGNRLSSFTEGGFRLKIYFAR